MADTYARSLSGVDVGQIVPKVEYSPARYWGPYLTIFVVLTWVVGLGIGFEASLSVLALTGYVAAVLGLGRPALGLLGIGMLCSLDEPAKVLLLTGQLWRYNMLNYWLILVMLLSIPFLLRLRDPQSRLLQAFLLLLGLQLAVTPDLMRGVQQVVNVVVLFGLLVYFAAASRDKETWFWVGVVNATVSAAGGLVFLLQLDRLPYVNPNAFATFPLTGLLSICLTYPMWAGSSHGRLGLRLPTIVSLAIVNLLWIFLSGSRGALLIAAFCFVFLFSTIPGLIRRVAFVAIALILSFAIFSQFPDLATRAWNRVGLLLDVNLDPRDRTSGRSDIVFGGWRIFLENPFGVGTGGFGKTWAGLGNLGGTIGSDYTKAGIEASSHSGWLKVLVENGIPGIVLFASYVLSFAVVGWSKLKRDPALLGLGLLVTMTLAIAFISRGFSDKGLWFLAAGVTAFMHRERVHSGHERRYD